MRAPTLPLGTVVTLSTMMRHGALNPLRSLGSMGRRNNGAGVGSVVNAQTRDPTHDSIHAGHPI